LSDDKKDLTRIEDLGEFIHELNEEEIVNEEMTNDLPEIPQEENSFETSFQSESEDLSFNSTDEVTDENSSSIDFSATESSLAFENTESTTSEDDPFSAETPESASVFDSTESFSSDSETIEQISQDEPLFSEQAQSIESTTESFQQNDDFQVETEIESSQSPVINPATETPDFYFEKPQDPEPTFEKTPLVETKEDTSIAFKAPENFSDVKQFAENTNFSGMASEGNPSFSVLLNGIKYIEDVNDILLMLKELGLLGDAEDQAKARLMRGT